MYLFDVSRPAEPRRLGRLRDSREEINAVAFSPDGSLLAAAGRGKTIRVWDLTAPGRPRPAAEQAPPRRDRHRRHDLAVEHADRSHPTQAAMLNATDSPLNTATFRPAGGVLVTAGADQTVRTWQTDERTIIATICQHTGDPITEQEWRTYLHDLPYEPPCRRDGTPA